MTQPIFRRFPDAARTIAKILEPLVGNPLRIGTRTPASLTGLMPFVRVVRRGGPSDDLNDYAYVYVDVIGDNLAAAEKLAEQIRQKLTTTKVRLGSIIVDRVTCDSAPEEVEPWASGINRYESRYTIVFRRYSAAA